MKEIKGIQIRNEEIKLSVFIDDMMIFVENPKETTKRIPTINEYSKYTGYKINTYKPIIFLYTLND